jgi:hypothetical protein
MGETVDVLVVGMSDLYPQSQDTQPNWTQPATTAQDLVVVVSQPSSVQSSMIAHKMMMNPSILNIYLIRIMFLTLVFRYSTFVRIGSGLTYADYVWIRAKPWKPWDEKNPPAFLRTAKKSVEDKGDVYLEPEESVFHISLYSAH